MRQEVRNGDLPDVVIHHPHWTDTSRTWSTALAGLCATLKPKAYASSGRWYRPVPWGGPRRRKRLDVVLECTSSIDVATVIVR
jgi:hypothetical protein